MPTGLELVLREPFPLQDRRVDCVEHQIVLRPGKVQQTEPVDVALVLGRQRDPVDRGLDVAPGQEAEGVARVDGQAAVERLGPLPLPRAVVLDLQRRHRLPEQQRDGAQVSEVGLVVHVPPMQLGEEVGRQLEGQRDQVVERVEDLVVQVLGEGFDLGEGFLDQVGDGLGDVAIVCC
ncbi:hypothetical protein PspLS_00201 [Pyricularia sp. CBS 133598]|nr:hypothetical protein PspLS_00201 [Pyricularia sp. CBS 133598]